MSKTKCPQCGERVKDAWAACQYCGAGLLPLSMDIANAGKQKTATGTKPLVIRPSHLEMELQRQGFSIVSQTQDRMVAVRKKRHKVIDGTDVVFVQSVANLRRSQIVEDIPRLTREAARLDPTRLRPRGWWRRFTAVVSVYLARVVEPDAEDLCRSIQAVNQPGFVLLPVAYDSTTGTTSFRRETDWQALGSSTLGAHYYPKLRFVAQRLLEPDLAPEKEPAMDYSIYHRSAEEWSEIFGD
jgi:hypothetical protein